MSSFAVGIIAGILCTVSFVPQVVKVFRTKETKALSVVTFSMFTLGVFFWFIYGLMIRQIEIILPNAIIFALAGAVLVMKIRYK